MSVPTLTYNYENWTLNRTDRENRNARDELPEKLSWLQANRPKTQYR